MKVELLPTMLSQNRHQTGGTLWAPVAGRTVDWSSEEVRRAFEETVIMRQVKSWSDSRNNWTTLWGQVIDTYAISSLKARYSA
jgi:hypothetical protein